MELIVRLLQLRSRLITCPVTPSHVIPLHVQQFVLSFHGVVQRQASNEEVGEKEPKNWRRAELSSGWH